MMIVTDSLLVAYVDGELDPATAQKVEMLLAANPEAVQRVAMFRETAVLLRAASSERFYAAKRPAARPSRRSVRPRLPYTWALAASLAAVIVFGSGVMWGGRAPSARAALIDEVADYHQFHSRETRYLVEVPANQVADLRAWVGQRIERNIDVPDLTDAGLRFAGGRMFAVNNHPVAELVYTRDRGLPVGVCVSQIESSAAPLTVEQRGAQRVASWIAGGYAYAVVGEIDDATARDIAQLVAAQIDS